MEPPQTQQNPNATMQATTQNVHENAMQNPVRNITLNPTQNPSDNPSQLFFNMNSGFSGSRGSFSGFDQQLKKKRGRPRKYGSGSSSGNVSLGVSQNPSGNGYVGLASGGSRGTRGAGGALGELGAGGGSEEARVAGGASGGAAEIGFTAHVLIIEPGEDIFSKMMAFSKEGPRTICVLSATGGISKASIKPSQSSDNTVTYEGRYEILSLKGSFTFSESNRTGGLNVTLSGPAGVVGGAVAYMLVAASPVQVIIGSFLGDGKKTKSVPSASPGPSILNFGSPPSQSGSTEENGGTH